MSSSSESGSSVTNELFKEHTQYTSQMQDMTSMVSTISVREDDALDNEYSSNRLFISNFPFSWTEKELRNFLKDFEPVAEVEIVSNERGSKGFGFVTINDPQRCMEARSFLNHRIVNGRRVEVRRAHKHKRAAKQNCQREMHNLASMIQQMTTLQAALVQPGLLNLLQQQLLTSNSLLSQQQFGVSGSAMNLAQSLQNVPSSVNSFQTSQYFQSMPFNHEVNRGMTMPSGNHQFINHGYAQNTQTVPANFAMVSEMHGWTNGWTSSGGSSESSDSPSPSHGLLGDAGREGAYPPLSGLNRALSNPSIWTHQ